MISIERHFIIGNAPNTGLEGSLARTGPRAGDLHGRLSKPKLNCWRLRHPSQTRLMLSRVAAVEGVEGLHDRGNIWKPLGNYITFAVLYLHIVHHLNFIETISFEYLSKE